MLYIFIGRYATRLKFKRYIPRYHFDKMLIVHDKKLILNQKYHVYKLDITYNGQHTNHCSSIYILCTFQIYFITEWVGYCNKLYG